MHSKNDSTINCGEGKMPAALVMTVRGILGLGALTKWKLREILGVYAS